MNIKNLEVGMVAKNYKDLCRILEVQPRKDGNGKISHINELKQFFNFERAEKGHALTITEIYLDIKEHIDKRTTGSNANQYTKDGELLLIDLLLCSKDYKVTLPMTSLLIALNMVNRNYSKYFGIRPKLSECLDIDIKYIHDYYDNVGASLYSSIKTIIGRLENKKLVKYREVTMVKELQVDTKYSKDGTIKPERKVIYNKDGIEEITYVIPQMKMKEVYREATTLEDKMIVKIEREEILALGFNKGDTKKVLYRDGNIHKYNKKVEARFYEELGFSKVYTAHRLIFNKEHLEDERKMILDDIEREMIKEGINSDIINNIMKNARNRQNNALKMIDGLVDFGEADIKINDKYLKRTNEEYLDYYKILNTLLISDSITKEKEESLINNKFTPKIELPEDM